MFDLISAMATSPDAQADPHYWAATFLGHFVIGLVICGAVAALIERAADWIDGHGRLAWIVTVAGYALLWEGAAQHLGAGVMDALVDSAAVALGAACGLLAWARMGKAVAAVVALATAIMVLGVGRRK